MPNGEAPALDNIVVPECSWCSSPAHFSTSTRVVCDKCLSMLLIAGVTYEEIYGKKPVEQVQDETEKAAS